MARSFALDQAAQTPINSGMAPVCLIPLLLMNAPDKVSEPEE
jgi:hypothetical protein